MAGAQSRASSLDTDSWQKPLCCARKYPMSFDRYFSSWTVLGKKSVFDCCDCFHGYRDLNSSQFLLGYTIYIFIWALSLTNALRYILIKFFKHFLNFKILYIFVLFLFELRAFNNSFPNFCINFLMYFVLD